MTWYQAYENEIFLKLYYFNSENELRNRMACSNKIKEYVVKKLIKILQIDPYSIFLKSLINILWFFYFYVLLKCDADLNQQTYNLPTTSKVAVIWVEQDMNNFVFSLIFEYIQREI